MMPYTSQSNRRKGKWKYAPKPKQEWRVKEQKRNWLELPNDIMATILYRVGFYDILENVQYVCTTWHKICKDPITWRVIHMDEMYSDRSVKPRLQKMCKHAVDRSQGQLVDLTLFDFPDDDVIEYVADRASRLRRLEIVWYYYSYKGLMKALKTFPLLEELSLYSSLISAECVAIAGRCCPKLKKFKMNHKEDRGWWGYDPWRPTILNEIPIAIGKNLHTLRHLEIIGMNISNIELQVILDGCCHLESLDLRKCFFVDLDGEFGKKCSEKIKCLKLPNDSIEGCPYIYRDGVPRDYWLPAMR